jgi:hypothetical protein
MRGFAQQVKVVPPCIEKTRNKFMRLSQFIMVEHQLQSLKMKTFLLEA